MRFVAWGDRKTLTAALRPIYSYSADTEEAAKAALATFEERYGVKYPAIAKMWRARWNELTPFLAYPNEIRKILYTTNAIESLNSRLSARAES